jgi:hypothetical protein
MKTSDELLAIKMTIKTLSVKVKRIENVNKKLKKIIAEKEDSFKVTESYPKNKVSYLERFDVNNLLNKNSGTEQQ